MPYSDAWCFHQWALDEGLTPNNAERFCRLVGGLILQHEQGRRLWRTNKEMKQAFLAVFNMVLDQQKHANVGASLARVFRPPVYEACWWDDNEAPVLGPMKVTWITTEEARRRWP